MYVDRDQRVTTTSTPRSHVHVPPLLVQPSHIANMTATEWVITDYSLSTLETIVADFGDNLSPKTATVAEIGDYSLQCGQGLRQCVVLYASVPACNRCCDYYSKSPISVV